MTRHGRVHDPADSDLRPVRHATAIRAAEDWRRGTFETGVFWKGVGMDAGHITRATPPLSCKAA